MKDAVTADFELVDHFGRSVTPDDYRGAPTIVFFGFTNCNMVCPRALGRLMGVLDALAPLTDGINALYITVDPDRDEPATMRAFLEESYPRFLGLTGTVEQIDRARAGFRVHAHTVPDPDDPDGYQMPHSAFTYLMDSDMRYVTHFTDAVEGPELEQRLAAALSTGSPGAL